MPRRVSDPTPEQMARQAANLSRAMDALGMDVNGLIALLTEPGDDRDGLHNAAVYRWKNGQVPVQPAVRALLKRLVEDRIAACGAGDGRGRSRTTVGFAGQGREWAAAAMAAHVRWSGAAADVLDLGARHRADLGRDVRRCDAVVVLGDPHGCPSDIVRDVEAVLSGRRDGTGVLVALSAATLGIGAFHRAWRLLCDHPLSGHPSVRIWGQALPRCADAVLSGEPPRPHADLFEDVLALAAPPPGVVRYPTLAEALDAYDALAVSRVAAAE